MTANPNNPTGAILGGAGASPARRRLCRRGAVLVIDSCFRAFDTRDAVRHLRGARRERRRVRRDRGHGQALASGRHQARVPRPVGPAIRLAIAEVAADILLTAPPFSDARRRAVRARHGRGGLAPLHARIAANRAILREELAEQRSGGSPTAIRGSSVSRIELPRGLSGTRLWGQLLRAASTRSRAGRSTGRGRPPASATCASRSPANPRSSPRGWRDRRALELEAAADRSLATVAMVLASSTSLQFGLAIATTAFAAAGPVGRSGSGASSAACCWRCTSGRRSARFTPRAALWRRRLRASRERRVGLRLSRARPAPLGIVSAIVMLGPLAVSAWGQRGDPRRPARRRRRRGRRDPEPRATGRPADRAARDRLRAAAAASLGAYIVAGKRVGKRFEGLNGLALALLIAAAIQTPLGLAFAKPGLVGPRRPAALCRRRCPRDAHPVRARDDCAAQPVDGHVRAPAGVRAGDRERPGFVVRGQASRCPSSSGSRS